MADVQVYKVGRFRYSGVDQVLQGHVVQEEVCQLCHGHCVLSQIRHGVIAKVQTSHLWQPGHRKEEMWRRRGKHQDLNMCVTAVDLMSGISFGELSKLPPH